MTSASVWLDAALRDARQMLESRITNDPQDVNALMVLGGLFMGLGRHADAPYFRSATLLALYWYADFESLQDLRGLKMWSRRSELLSRLDDTNGVAGIDFGVPLDGRTLRRDHFETVWQVFGFPDRALPEHHSHLALEDLANGRNEVAHGESDPVLFGRTKASIDVQRMIDRVDAIAIHLYNSANTYITSRGYEAKS